MNVVCCKKVGNFRVRALPDGWPWPLQPLDSVQNVIMRSMFMIYGSQTIDFVYSNWNLDWVLCWKNYASKR